MSEYQYYEFRRIDGQLGAKEMQELRACSSRARITPGSFTNEYSYGDFKGNADAWMEKYFDAFLYLANWGTREFQIAMPSGLIPIKTAKQYFDSASAGCREKNGKLILKFYVDEEPDGEWLEGEGELDALVGIRSELRQGDLRSLYLGWLIGVQAGEAKGQELEPPVPPNLGALSEAQTSLAKFFGIDAALLAAAAQNSSIHKAGSGSSKARAAWLASLPMREKHKILLEVMEGEPAKISMELQSRFLQQKGADQPADKLKPRTVAELLSAAKLEEL